MFCWTGLRDSTKTLSLNSSCDNMSILTAQYESYIRLFIQNMEDTSIFLNLLVSLNKRESIAGPGVTRATRASWPLDIKIGEKPTSPQTPEGNSFPIVVQKTTLLTCSHLLSYLHFGNVPGHTCLRLRELHRALIAHKRVLCQPLVHLSFSGAHLSAFFFWLSPLFICFYNALCLFHLLNPPCSIQFMCIPPGLPQRSPGGNIWSKAPGRRLQAGVGAAKGALLGICLLGDPVVSYL